MKILSKRPTIDEVMQLLRACVGRRIRMTYKTQCRRKPSKSILAACADTTFVHPLDVVRGRLDEVWVSEEGNPVLRLPSKNRLKKLPKGQGYYENKRRGQRLWRTYRVKGIVLRSLRVEQDGVMARACPNATIKHPRASK